MDRKQAQRQREAEEKVGQWSESHVLREGEREEEEEEGEEEGRYEEVIEIDDSNEEDALLHAKEV